MLNRYSTDMYKLGYMSGFNGSFSEYSNDEYVDGWMQGESKRMELEARDRTPEDNLYGVPSRR